MMVAAKRASRETRFGCQVKSPERCIPLLWVLEGHAAVADMSTLIVPISHLIAPFRSDGGVCEFFETRRFTEAGS